MSSLMFPTKRCSPRFMRVLLTIRGLELLTYAALTYKCMDDLRCCCKLLLYKAVSYWCVRPEATGE